MEIITGVKKCRHRKKIYRLLYAALAICHVAVDLCYSQETILIVRQSGKDFEDVCRGVREDLGKEFKIKENIIDKKTTYNEFTKAIAVDNPKLLILMDNGAIGFYQKYQNSLKDGVLPIPSISLMGVLIKKAISQLRNATGIAYEVPLTTSIVSLRAILDRPIKKVGIVHRAFLEEFLSENKKFCEKEGITIINVELPDRNEKYKTLIRKALKELGEKEIDALWIPNDNGLLRPELIKTVWIPNVNKLKIPVIVGVEVLVNPKLNFGTFAVIPDNVSLGGQAAEMVYTIAENNWIVEEKNVEPPLAVYKIINIQQAKKIFSIPDEKLQSIDKKLK